MIWWGLLVAACWIEGMLIVVQEPAMRRRPRLAALATLCTALLTTLLVWAVFP